MKRPILGALCALYALAWTAANAAPLSFGLFGDTPYGRWDRAELPRMLAAMGRENLAFVVHDGDIKSSDTRCSDELYRDIHGVFSASPVPLIYVPGDNEWSDCGSVDAGAYSPAERLDRLREIFFADDRALGHGTLALERQDRFPENARWRLGDQVQLVSLNLPGGNNFRGKQAQPSADYTKREAANRHWLSEAFRLARERQQAALVIVIQADPHFRLHKLLRPNPDGYAGFLELLTSETVNFPGHVVLVHGDSHRFRIDQPLKHPSTGVRIANFTRVETYGWPLLGWIKATFDPTLPQRFRFEAHPWGPSRPLP